MSTQPGPDFERLRKVLLREGDPDRIPFIELYIDKEIMEAILGEKVPELLPGELADGEHEAQERYLDMLLQFQYQMGYDYVPGTYAPGIFGFGVSAGMLLAEDTAALSRGERSWVNESRGVITNWEDFESFPWPEPEELDYSSLEYMAEHLADGMKLICDNNPGGILESVMWLMGYTSFSYALADDPDLVAAMFERVGSLTTTALANMAEIDNMGALCLGDDMGFKSATMISPELLRKYVFPWQKKLADIAHQHGLPFVLHSCGNLEEVMDDLTILSQFLINHRGRFD